MCIGLVLLKGTENCHAVLIKDYRNLTKDDLVIHLSKTKELFAGFKNLNNILIEILNHMLFLGILRLGFILN
jgi:hypothetical protein